MSTPQAPPNACLSKAQIDTIITRCAKALARHRRDSLFGNAKLADEARAAIESTQQTLAELLPKAPPEARARIEELLRL